MFSPPDFYTRDLEIPKDVHFEKPLSEIDENYQYNNLDFQLFNSFQSGIYVFHFWYVPKENGELYIRAFEYTQNDELSKDRLKDRTLIKVSKSDSIQFYSKDFTIYEGNWGEHYASRIEVWFKSEKNIEQKIISKNYIIEGWQR